MKAGRPVSVLKRDGGTRIVNEITYGRNEHTFMTCAESLTIFANPIADRFTEGCRDRGDFEVSIRFGRSGGEIWFIGPDEMITAVHARVACEGFVIIGKPVRLVGDQTAVRVPIRLNLADHESFEHWIGDPDQYHRFAKAAA